MRRAGALALGALLAAAYVPGPATSRAATAGADAGAPGSGRLPEDPVLAAKSTAEWREHLVAEERERKLRYDRDRLKHHRAVVRAIVAARARYDRAGGKAAVAAVRARAPQALADVRARIAKIDHWGTNSNLLADYDALLIALADGYPAARLSALDGDRAPLATLRAEFDRRLTAIKAWLAEAASAKDE